MNDDDRLLLTIRIACWIMVTGTWCLALIIHAPHEALQSTLVFGTSVGVTMLALWYFIDRRL